MEIIRPAKGIIHVRMDSQYDLAMSFMRVQEFYESPYENIRGKNFTHEQYMDTYAKDTGNFTYPSDWNGFNVPGNVWVNFFSTFTANGDWSSKEKRLMDAVNKETDNLSTNKFYVIGTWNDGSLDHEYSHAFWYLNSEYRKHATKLLKKVDKDTRKILAKWILGVGYTKGVVDDESVAYLSTSSMCWFTDRLKVSTMPWNQVYDLQAYFNETKNKLMDD